jgi:hypothetical protein
MTDYGYNPLSDVVNSSYWSASLHNTLLHNTVYLYNRIATDGWLMAGETWVYVSATSFKVTGVDVTAKYRKGTKIKLTDAASTKYFYVIAASFSTDTTITITAGADFSLSGGAITNPYYSYAACPVGHPIWFSWTITWGGFSVNPALYIARFMLVGNACIAVMACGTGTSNATTFTVSAPIASTTLFSSSYTWSVSTGQIVDNGSAVANGMLSITGGGATIFNLYKSALGAWTNSGTKSASFQITYEI